MRSYEGHGQRKLSKQYFQQYGYLNWKRNS